MDFKYIVITAFLLLIFSATVAQGYYNQENFGNRSLLLNETLAIIRKTAE